MATNCEAVIGLISALNFYDLPDEIAHKIFAIIKSSTCLRVKEPYYILRSIQTTWSVYLKKQGLTDAPQDIMSIINTLNEKLGNIF